jgi:3-keto-disaccharide hydrolase
MRKLLVLLGLLAAGAVRLAGTGAQQGAAADARGHLAFLGAWNITGTAPDDANVYWLEVTTDAGQLRGMFLNRVGNPAPLGVVTVDNGELIFQAGTADRPTGPEYRARLTADGRLAGHHTVTQSGAEHVINWIGVRPPTWPASLNANAPHTFDAPIVLFDNKTLDMWNVQVPGRPIGWRIADGVMTNAPPADSGNLRWIANNLVSKEKFINFKIEAEYKVEAGSNSGIYLRGRYELQILDDFGDTTGRPDFGHMAIYGRTPPRVNASKPAGEWQTMEATLVGNRVTVTLNGQRVHDNAVITGITGGALDNDELSPGPIMIQGDHRSVWIRKLIVRTITR